MMAGVALVWTQMGSADIARKEKKYAETKKQFFVRRIYFERSVSPRVESRGIHY